MESNYFMSHLYHRYKQVKDTRYAEHFIMPYVSDSARYIINNNTITDGLVINIP